MSLSESPDTDLSEDLDYILNRATKDQVERCARLLGAYLALYKSHFGELTPEQFQTISLAVDAGDDYTRDVCIRGCKEVLDMLALVALQELERDPTRAGSSSIN